MKKAGMFRVICLASIILLMVATVFTAGIGNAATAKTVKIGYVWPLTGGSSTIGQQHNDGALWAIKEINAKGGIKSMGGAKIVPVTADSETKPDVGANQTERLIIKEGVSLVVGCYNSAVCFPASEVAQRYKTPFISQGGVKNEITERGYEWVFRVNNKATYDVEEMLKGIDLVSKENKVQMKTYALVYESTDWGSDNAKVWKKFADQRGWKCVLDEPVTVGQSDMSSQILKIKNANPDVVNVSFYTPEMIVFSRAMLAHRVNPRLGVWSVGGGSQDPAYFKALQPKAYEYNFVQEDWDVSGPLNHKWIKKLAAQVQKKNGYQLNSFFAQGWTATYVAYEALEKAGSADKTAIKNALKNLDIKNSENCRVILSGYPRIKFDENGQNTYSTGTIIQYQNGKGVGLSPADHRTRGAKAIAPIPNDFATRAAKVKK
jgi:branched-chain amino acid transport system substrate-binding protein